MGDKSPEDITSEPPETPSIPTESLPSPATKPPKLCKRRKSRKHSNASIGTVDPPQEGQEEQKETPPEQTAPPAEETQPSEESPPKPPAEPEPTPQNDNKNTPQEKPQDPKPNMSTETTDDVTSLTKDVGEKAAPAKETIREITTGGMDMKIDDEDLNWKSSDKEGSLQIRIRLNLRAKVQLNLDARVKGEVVIGLL
ncbi:hypothetical protein BO94DRAFT_579315 [Aspergillus sclerotioniger CBS 115572]|uniref:Uncharacterized protein n=1 Tax=Aspergillus sclerotioniger CBS 115572 TaxID=1450535 RepID=A0A317V4F7_9EURO|nr:hypothetical protein BO94DRAFT_579315 [Aspergillus sclerotioniger CBS 115572]PWY68529.1 hypothetical protein BO94DRAFT_579315 [Aspergillus sclerotioniger CBS 115572]